MIQGVMTKQLRALPDERGRLMELLRADDEMFERFGQVYVTTVYPGVVKAWHYHKKQADNIAVVIGMAKVVLYDDREDSPTRGELNEFFVGVHNPMLIHIPPLVYHGFKGISPEEAVVVNCTSEVYNRQEPDEYRIPPHAGEVPYDWSRQDG